MLVDCGQFQGGDANGNAHAFGFDPATIDNVLITHAHIDHCGALPRLVREGYRGRIGMTKPTALLARIMLLDAAKLAEEAARGSHAGPPEFTRRDAWDALRRRVGIEYEQGFRVRRSRLLGRFLEAGHILGSASIQLKVPVGRRTSRTVVFSGDLGRPGAPLHSDPHPLAECDVLVVESTYGDRLHDPRPVEEQLEEVLAPALQRGGTVLIPAFAVGRAQLITLLVARLIEAGRLPSVPVHLDSPMAADVTATYTRFLRTDALAEPEAGAQTLALLSRGVQYHRSVRESRSLEGLAGPRIIIASSGMLTGGRVLHHLARLAPSPENLVVLAGYQAPGTPGRALLEHQPAVQVDGEQVEVRADVAALGGLSAHADRAEILRWIESAPRRPELVLLNHGEPAAAGALQQALVERGYRARVAATGERVDLG